MGSLEGRPCATGCQFQQSDTKVDFIRRGTKEKRPNAGDKINVSVIEEGGRPEGGALLSSQSSFYYFPVSGSLALLNSRSLTPPAVETTVAQLQLEGAAAR